MQLTVAICTWNRARRLDEALRSLHALRVPPGLDWELLVVANACTDDTSAVAARHAAQLPIRLLLEPRPGKSNALNRAVGEARGAWLVWTDDDVRVDPDWLAAYHAAFLGRPGASFLGGPIRVQLVGDPPGWLQRALPVVADAYGLRELGPVPFPFTPQRLPFGANWAVRTRDQARYPYDPQLGVRPGRALRGEETDVMRRMLADGAEGWWVPDAVVHHRVPAENQTRRFLRRYFRAEGESLGRRMGDPELPTLFGRPRGWWKRAVASELRYRIGALFRNPEVWSQDLVTSALYWGQLRGYGRR